MNDRRTFDVYAERAQEYADTTAPGIPDDPMLADFIAGLPPGARVLDLGCGPGGFAKVMADAGLDVVAMDPVPEMVALATAAKGVTARLGSFDDLDEIDAYDGIWANFSLLHAPRTDMPRHLAAVHAALRKGGKLHLAVKTGKGEKRDSLGRLYTYYEPAELTSLLRQAGFVVRKTTKGRDKGLDGTMADWIAVAADG